MLILKSYIEPVEINISFNCLELNKPISCRKMQSLCFSHASLLNLISKPTFPFLFM